MPGPLKNFLCVHLYVCMCGYICPVLRLLITSDMIWTPYDWLKKFYSFHMAATVGIVSRHGLTVEGHCINQPNKCKLALCKS